MMQLVGASKLLGEAIRKEHDLMQYLGLLPDLGIVCRQVIIIILVKPLYFKAFPFWELLGAEDRKHPGGS